MLTQTIEINLTQSKLSSIIMRSEEKGREIAFSVIDEAGDPVALEDYSVKFLMLKPDDNVVYADVVSGVLTQTEQMTTSKGAGYYCIRIIDAGTVIYSGQGRVLVDDHVIDDETLNSISEVDGYIFPDDFATHAWVEEYVDEHTGSDVIANPDTAPTDTLETVTIEDTTYDIIHPAVNASGNPVDITDAAAAPMVKCVSAITGSQDLHGYDKPWVGGAGKNKLPMTVSGIKGANTSGTWNGNAYTLNGVTFTVETDGDDNVTGIKANGTSTADWVLLNIPTFTLTAGNYILNGCINGELATYRIDMTPSGTTNLNGDTAFSVSENSQFSVRCVIRQSGYTANNVMLYPMIRLSTVTDPTFAPYSNICPITAYNQSTISVEDENEVVQQTSTATFSNSIYQGNADFVGGKARATWGYIASYNGETLPGEWISSMDEYAPGTTPTTGAQVAYELASPTEETITPTNLPIKSLFGYNHIESTTGDMDITYIKRAYQPIIQAAEQADNDLVRVKAAYNAASLSNTDITINYQDYDALVIYVNDALTQCGVSSLYTREYLDYCRANNRTLTFFPYGTAYISYNILTDKLEYAGDNNQGFYIIRIDGINYRR